MTGFDCNYLSSLDGEDGNGLQLEKVGPTFSSSGIDVS